MSVHPQPLAVQICPSCWAVPTSLQLKLSGSVDRIRIEINLSSTNRFQLPRTRRFLPRIQNIFSRRRDICDHLDCSVGECLSITHPVGAAIDQRVPVARARNGLRLRNGSDRGFPAHRGTELDRGSNPERAAPGASV